MNLKKTLTALALGLSLALGAPAVQAAPYAKKDGCYKPYETTVAAAVETSSGVAEAAQDFTSPRFAKSIAGMVVGSIGTIAFTAVGVVVDTFGLPVAAVQAIAPGSCSQR